MTLGFFYVLCIHDKNIKQIWHDSNVNGHTAEDSIHRKRQHSEPSKKFTTAIVRLL